MMTEHSNVENAFWLIAVAALWGSTNPFIKKGSQGIENIKHDSRIRQFLAELGFLFFNWKYLIPFLVNQSGSVLFYITLASAELSLAVPLTNSLTFIFTSLSGRLLGEKIHHWETYAGMVCVVLGVALCVYSKT
ncbi:transmembrane protein 234 homolog isoform X2 [Haliotis rubra]|uniref:transmembrane protein 234 homolog isoform X2 n=1 Tax=Haliotis rubra TaxID=36100 RepID=UPI001EE51739|nr:transmembrane protein 234 homolog isoform X2 [Haliotis rubra]